jgi:hypothetical protein
MIKDVIVNRTNQPRGTALIIAMVVVLLLASLAAVLANEMVTRAFCIEVDQEDLLAFEAAEAGIDAAINDINSSLIEPLTSTDPASTHPAIFDSGQHPVYVHSYYSPLELGTVCPGGWNPLIPYKPGCIGTLNWVPPGPKTPTDQYQPLGFINAFPVDKNLSPNANYKPNDDLIPSTTRDANYVPRPRWKSVEALAIDGTTQVHDPNIIPVALGDLAFFTYAIDWFHDKRDNSYPMGKYPSGAGNYPVTGGPLGGPDGLTFGDHSKDQITERNMYTIYSTGIHNPGTVKTGIRQEGHCVTIEVVVEATDFGSPFFNTGPLEFFVKPR